MIIQGSPVLIRAKSTNQSTPILPKPSPRIDTGKQTLIQQDPNLLFYLIIFGVAGGLGHSGF